MNTSLSSVRVGLLSVAVFALSYFLINFKTFSNSCDRSGDYSLILLQTTRAQALATYEGPYSRFGFRHPGPIAFYTYAALTPFGEFARYDQGKVATAQFLLNIFFLGTAAVAVSSLISGILTGPLLLSLVSLFFFAARPTLWHDFWGPATLVAPMLCILFAGSAVALGRLQFVFPWIFAVIFSLSNHLGSAPVIAPLVLLTLAQLFLRRQTYGSPSTLQRSSIYAAFLITILTLIPFCYDIFTQSNWGNFGKIIQFVFHSSKSEHAWGEVIRYVSSYFLVPFSRGISLSTPWRIALCLILFALLTPILKDKKIELRTSACHVALAALLLFPAAHQVHGKLYQYLLMYGFAVGASLWLILIHFYFSKFTPHFLLVHRRPAIVIGIASCLLILLAFLQQQRSPQCVGKYAALIQDWKPSQDVLYELHIKHRNQWGTLASLTSALYRSGYRVCVDKSWAFMFTEGMTCDAIRSTLPPQIVSQKLELIQGATASSSPIAKIGDLELVLKP